MVRWTDSNSGDVLLNKLRTANSFLQRLAGLQFAKPLEPDGGLLLRHCRSVHTFCLRFSIDVAFLSRDFEVLELRLNVRPWRLVVPKSKGVEHVIEVTAGYSRKWFVGQQTQIIPTDWTL